MSTIDQSLEGPQFIQRMGPLVDALRDAGGSAKPSEVRDRIVEKLGISEEEQSEMLENGQSRLMNQIYWARFYLSRCGYIDSSKRGVWALTEKAYKTPMTHDEALSVFREVRERYAESKKTGKVDQPGEGLEDELEETQLAEHRAAVRERMLVLSPGGFEKLSQRLLREAGFQEVRVTGRSGDGGIDGDGVLQINPLVSFKVLFQCKRYSGAVGASQIRDFRGAMTGRADKGIIITTGTFTSDARKEGVRDGAPPIELVDGEKLIDMLEDLELGLIPRTTYDVDEDFFAGFE